MPGRMSGRRRKRDGRGRHRGRKRRRNYSRGRRWRRNFGRDMRRRRNFGRDSRRRRNFGRDSRRRRNVAEASVCESLCLRATSGLWGHPQVPDTAIGDTHSLPPPSCSQHPRMPDRNPSSRRLPRSFGSAARRIRPLHGQRVTALGPPDSSLLN